MSFNVWADDYELVHKNSFESFILKLLMTDLRYVKCLPLTMEVDNESIQIPFYNDRAFLTKLDRMCSDTNEHLKIIDNNLANTCFERRLYYFKPDQFKLYDDYDKYLIVNNKNQILNNFEISEYVDIFDKSKLIDNKVEVCQSLEFNINPARSFESLNNVKFLISNSYCDKQNFLIHIWFHLSDVSKTNNFSFKTTNLKIMINDKKLQTYCDSFKQNLFCVVQLEIGKYNNLSLIYKNDKQPIQCSKIKIFFHKLFKTKFFNN